MGRVDRASDPTPAEGALFEVLLARLTAQMIDDTSRALRLYTPKTKTCQRESVSATARERKRGREKMCQTCNDKGTRKESVASGYGLVTVYSNF